MAVSDQISLYRPEWRNIDIITNKKGWRESDARQLNAIPASWCHVISRWFHWWCNLLPVNWNAGDTAVYHSQV